MHEPPPAPASVAANIDQVLRVETEIDQPHSVSEAITDTIGRFTGTVTFVVLQILLVAVWIALNTAPTGLHPFDPYPFPLLSTLTSTEAVLLAAFVLMRQNRMISIADRRDHMDLQVNLLTERETTHIIHMLDRLSAHLNVEQSDNAESQEFRRNVSVEQLHAELRRRMPDTGG